MEEGTVEIALPKLFANILPLPFSDLAIEHAPLDGRFLQAVLAETLQDCLSAKYDLNFLFVTKRPKALSAQLDKWIDQVGAKVKKTEGGQRFLETNCTIIIKHHDDVDINDLPYTSFYRICVGEAHHVALPAFRALKKLCRRHIIAVGEMQDAEEWFYKWSREQGVKHVKLKADDIVLAFGDQRRTLKEIRAVFTKDEQRRYLELEDIEVVARRRTPYLQWVMGMLPNYCNYPASEMHKDMDQTFARMSSKRRQKELVIGPRDSAKSTHGAEGYPLYCVCHGIEKYILIISDTTDQAVKHLEVIKEELESNEQIAEQYPEVFGPGPIWKNNAIVTRNGIRIEALGAGKKIRGRRYKNFRPTLIIGDDFEGDEAAYSSKTRDHRRNWFTKGVMKAGSANVTNYLALGSNLHPECLVAHILGSPGWNGSVYKSIITWPDRMDLWEKWERILRDTALDKPLIAAQLFYEENKEEMNRGAKVLWPEREDLYTLMLMRATDGHAAFESEKQNNPIDPSLCEWGPHLFQDKWFDQWPDNLQVIVGALDASKGKSDRVGDYQGMVAVGIDPHLRVFVDADINRRPMDQMCERYVSFLNEVGASIGVCEADQFQELLLPEIEDSSIEAKMTCSIEPITTEGINKTLRIRRVGPWINRGRMLFRRGSPGAMLLIKQLQEFPNGSFDDGPDGLEMALRRALEALGASVDDLRNPF